MSYSTGTTALDPDRRESGGPLRTRPVRPVERADGV